MTPAAALAVSRSFYQAYSVCLADDHASNAAETNTIVPGVVCLAFSIELALKSILIADGVARSGHKLDKLFDALSSERQQEIIFQSAVEEISFRQNMAEIADAFVEWRYIHETAGEKTISVQFLLMLQFALDKVAERRARSDA